MLGSCCRSHCAHAPIFSGKDSYDRDNTWSWLPDNILHPEPSYLPSQRFNNYYLELLNYYSYICILNY